MKKIIKTNIWISAVFAFLYTPHILHAFPINYVQDLSVGYESKLFLKGYIGYEPSPFKDLWYRSIIPYTDDTVYYYFKDLVIPHVVLLGGMKLGNTNLIGGLGMYTTVSSTSPGEMGRLDSEGGGFSLIFKWQPYAGKRLLLGIESDFNYGNTEISEDTYSNFAFVLCPSIKLRQSKNFSIYATPSLFTSRFSSDKLEPSIDIITRGLSISGGVTYNWLDVFSFSPELGLLFTNKGNSVFLTVSFTLLSADHEFKKFKDSFYKAQDSFEKGYYNEALKLYNEVLKDYQKWNKYGELSLEFTKKDLITRIELCEANIRKRQEKEAAHLLRKAQKEVSTNNWSSAKRLCSQIISDYSSTKAAVQAQEMLEDIRKIKEQREKEASRMLKQAEEYYKKGYYKKTNKVCSEILDKYGETNTAPEARTLLEKSKNATIRAVLKSRRGLVLSNFLHKRGFTNLEIAYIKSGLASIKPENGALFIIEGLGMSLDLFDAIDEFRKLTFYQRLYVVIFTAEKFASATTGDTKGSAFLYVKEKLLYDWIPLPQSIIFRLATITLKIYSGMIRHMVGQYSIIDKVNSIF